MPHHRLITASSPPHYRLIIHCLIIASLSTASSPPHHCLIIASLSTASLSPHHCLMIASSQEHALSDDFSAEQRADGTVITSSHPITPSLPGSHLTPAHPAPFHPSPPLNNLTNPPCPHTTLTLPDPHHTFPCRGRRRPCLSSKAVGIRLRMSLCRLAPWDLNRLGSEPIPNRTRLRI